MKVLAHFTAEFSNIKSRAGFMLALLIYTASFGQSNNNEDEYSLAEKLFNTYHKFGLHTGISSLYVENEPNAVSFQLEKPRAFEIGVTYNFYQYKNYNFTASIAFRTYDLTNFEQLKKEDLNFQYDVAGDLTVGPNSQWKVNVEMNYLFKIFKKLNGYVGIGPEVFLVRKIYGTGAALTTLEDGKEVGFTTTDDYNKNVFFGASASLGLYIQTKPLLLQPFFTYHYQPNKLYTETVKTQNLIVSENTVSEHHITGNYLMFGLKIIPSRSLFRSNKNN